MPEFKPLIEIVRAGQNLSAAQSADAAHLLTLAEVDATAKAEFLKLLHAKGETVEEVTAIATTFRGLARDPGLRDMADQAIDIVGTGGTGSMGYNVSSVTAMIVAASGTCKVLKHGNRAITSQSGSADFLAALGFRMDDDPQALRKAAEQLNFCFFFAPAFHPAFKEIMPVRKALAEAGQRSVFNILGPLINPAQPAHQLLGVFHPRWVKPLAECLHELGLRRGMVVCTELPDGKYMDEFATAGINHVQGLGSLSALSMQTANGDWDLPAGDPYELRGGNAEDNIGILKQLMRGSGPKTLRDSILLNAAAAFHIIELDADVDSGIQRARDILLGGALVDWLSNARDFYASK